MVLEEMNILVLGQTGVGKSTWINAIANYITFDALEDAAVRELITLIPTRFHHTDYDLNQVLIETGRCTNESFDDKKSSTKFPRAYTFEHGDRLYRIIDTPGIGDCDGIEVDKRNMANIMNFVGKYGTVHAICILLLPNETRLTETFQFCFKELLIQFHRSAASNIIFCFTNTSGYGFRPAETLKPLKILLNEIKERQNVDIVLNRDRAYSFDNMAYRFQCMYQSQNDVRFSDQEIELYKKSYEISKSETERMLNYINGIKPHNAKDSLNINYVRSIVTCLSDPLAAISNAVQMTINKIDERRELIKNCKHNEEDLRKLLMKKIKLVHWKMQVEDREWCKRCAIEKHYVGADRLKIIEADPSQQANDPVILMTVKTWFEIGDGKQCPNCGPDTNRVRSDKLFTQYEEEEEEEDVEVASEIKGKEEIMAKLAREIAQDEELKRVLKGEQDKIVTASAKCAHFLHTYSITPYNDSTESYLKKLIELQKNHGQNEAKLKSYQGMLEKYQEEKRIITAYMKKSSGETKSITPEEMLKVIDELKTLKHYGKDIANAYKNSQKMMNFDAKGEQLEYNFRPKNHQSRINRAWKYITGRN